MKKGLIEESIFDLDDSVLQQTIQAILDNTEFAEYIRPISLSGPTAPKFLIEIIPTAKTSIIKATRLL